MARLKYLLVATASALVAPALLVAMRVWAQGWAATWAWLRAEVARQPEMFVCFAVIPLIMVAVAGFSIGRMVEHIETTALHDGLTGLWNRRYAETRIGPEILRARREATPLALLMIDVDHLKLINDVGGHQAGDKALRAVATEVAAACRRSDVPTRWGGDEFLVIAPAASAGDALRLGQRIRERVAGTGHSVSIGVAELKPGATVEALIAEADRAVYMAKAGGRDRVISTDLPLLAP